MGKTPRTCRRIKKSRALMPSLDLCFSVPKGDEVVDALQYRFVVDPFNHHNDPSLVIHSTYLTIRPHRVLSGFIIRTLVPIVKCPILWKTQFLTVGWFGVGYLVCGCFCRLDRPSILTDLLSGGSIQQVITSCK